MPEITMAGGHVVLVDASDFSALAEHSWHRHSGGYATRNVRVNGRCVQLYMHRVIACPPDDMTVDHINGNRLDNRRANLRVCTQRDNSRNMRPRHRGEKTSRFKGVRRHRVRAKWEAYIRIAGVQKWLGTFTTEDEAAAAYDHAAREVFGEFARTNLHEGAA